jgi:hypothetical protein
MPNYRATLRYARCIHTCVEGGCKNKLRSVLWHRNGSPLQKHVINNRLHVDCTEECPGFTIMGENTGKFVFQTITTRREVAEEFGLEYDGNTDEDIMDVDGSVDHNKQMDVEDTSPHPEPDSEESDNRGPINLDDTPDQMHHQPTEVQHRSHFNIIYVPDPTHRKSLQDVLNELHFLKTKIYRDKWDSIKHLDGSIHLIHLPKRSGEMVHEERIFRVSVLDMRSMILNLRLTCPLHQSHMKFPAFALQFQCLS